MAGRLLCFIVDVGKQLSWGLLGLLILMDELLILSSGPLKYEEEDFNLKSSTHFKWVATI